MSKKGKQVQHVSDSSAVDSTRDEGKTQHHRDNNEHVSQSSRKSSSYPTDYPPFSLRQADFPAYGAQGSHPEQRARHTDANGYFEYARGNGHSRGAQANGNHTTAHGVDFGHRFIPQDNTQGGQKRQGKQQGQQQGMRQQQGKQQQQQSQRGQQQAHQVQQRQQSQQGQQHEGTLFAGANLHSGHQRAALSAYERLRNERGPHAALQQLAKQYEKGYRKGGGVEGAISAVTEGEVIRAPRPESAEDDEWDDDLSVAEEKRISQAFLALEQAMAGYRARKTGAKPSSQGLFEGREVHPQRQRQALDTFARLSQEKGEGKAMKKMSKLYDKGYRKGGIEGAISAVTEGKVEKAPRPESAEDDEWEDDLSVAEEKRIAHAFLALERAMEPHVHAQVEKRRSKGKAAADISHRTHAQQGQQGQQGQRVQGQQSQQRAKSQQGNLGGYERSQREQWSSAQQQQQRRASNNGNNRGSSSSSSSSSDSGSSSEEWEDMPASRRNRGPPLHAAHMRNQHQHTDPALQQHWYGPGMASMDPRHHGHHGRQYFNGYEPYPRGGFW